MAMYTDLLAAALDARPSCDDNPTRGEVLSALRRCREQLSVSSHGRRGWALDAVADQLAYDVALIDLARLLGIDCHVFGFDQPSRERARLEKELVARGV